MQRRQKGGHRHRRYLHHNARRRTQEETEHLRRLIQRLSGDELDPSGGVRPWDDRWNHMNNR
jgi:hypothetical protein